MSQTSARDVLVMLGFEEDWGAMTDQQPGYTIDLGNIRLRASEVLGKSFRPVILVTGTARSKRSLKRVEFELPLKVENFEQGVALIVRGIGHEYEPEKPIPWFGLGIKWQDRLPTPGC